MKNREAQKPRRWASRAATRPWCINNRTWEWVLVLEILRTRQGTQECYQAAARLAPWDRPRQARQIMQCNTEATRLRNLSGRTTYKPFPTSDPLWWVGKAACTKVTNSTCLRKVSAARAHTQDKKWNNHSIERIPLLYMRCIWIKHLFVIDY